MSRFLLTSDVHLSPRPRDSYRWGIFKWLATQAKSREVDAIFILGDLTDQKDNHSNRFINQVVDEIRALRKTARVIFIKGNHDYSDPKAPLLRFLEDFYIVPTELAGYDEKIALLPHSRVAQADWGQFNTPDYDLALCHQTFSGAIAETGSELPGWAVNVMKAKVVISGDVHVPQKLGHVRYCGAPHPVRFGDSFEPRVLYWKDGELKSIPRTTIRKLSLECEDPKELVEDNISEGDQVKVQLRLPRSRFGEWEELRAEVRKLSETGGWELCGLELLEKEGSAKERLRGKPKRHVGAFDLFTHFCSENKVDPELAELGHRLLRGDGAA